MDVTPSNRNPSKRYSSINHLHTADIQNKGREGVRGEAGEEERQRDRETETERQRDRETEHVL